MVQKLLFICTYCVLLFVTINLMLIPPSIHYMNNFYVSARYLGLNVIIFHDNLTEKIVSKYTTDKISFKKIEMHQTLSINDYKYIIFNEWSKFNPYKRI